MRTEIGTHSESSVAKQELCKVLRLQLERVRRHWSIRMRLPRINHHVKTLIALDERVDETNGVARAHVVVFVARFQHQLALEIVGDVDVGWHVNPEHAVWLGCWIHNVCGCGASS